MSGSSGSLHTGAGGAAFATGEQTPLAGTESTTTLVAGSSFVLCDLAGDITPTGVHGYFAGDTRLLDRLQLRVAHQVPRINTHRVDESELWSIASVGDPVRPSVLVERRMCLAEVLTVELTLEHLDDAAITVPVEIALGADFADVFDVKLGVRPRAGFIGTGLSNGALVLAYESFGFRRALRASCDHEYTVLRDGLQLEVELGPRGRATVTFLFQPESARNTPLAASDFGPVDQDRWEADLPAFTASSVSLCATWARSCADLGTLLLAGEPTSRRPIVAAGSPWFMALFGRDSLITSWSALLVDPGIALGTLAALAERQGVGHVTASAEQPGRILHELRAGEVVLRPGGWGAVYYGSVDATPLFVMAVAEAWRWGAPVEEIEALLPAAERAVEWTRRFGDADGDLFVEYGEPERRGIAALANQGWKDSDDAIRMPDGSIAQGPIALVEVQGYVHAALLALADLREAFHTGDPEPLRQRATALRAAIDEHFWMPDEDCYALALDGDKHTVRTVTSNAGHLLWTGTALPERVGPLSERLMADDMFTGYGLRTLSSANPGYNPLSYHCGSVWPHDTAIVAAGMLEHGAKVRGRQLADAVLDAADGFGGRPPELFAGFERSRFPGPIPYPTSCSPQAWASAATLMLVRALLGLGVDAPGGTIELDPCLAGGSTIEISGIALGDDRMNVAVRGHQIDHCELSGRLTLAPRRSAGTNAGTP